MLAPILDAWQRSPLRQRFLALSARERRLAMIVAATAGLFLVYAIVDPLFRFHASASARYASEWEDLQWMRANRDAVEISATEDAGEADPQSRLSAINSVAKEYGLVLRRIQPEEGAVSVQVENRSFETVIRWSHALENRRGFEIADASIDVQGPGIVNARFRVR